MHIIYDGSILCYSDCHNNSKKNPGFSYYWLPPKRKKILKVWIHRIGWKNLRLNNNTTVCSNHFVNSVRRWLRKDDVPMLNLPVLPTSATAKRNSPWKRCETSNESDETSEENDSDTDYNISSKKTCRTELIMVEIQHKEKQLKEMKQKVTELKKKIH